MGKTLGAGAGLTVSPQDIYAISATQKLRLGTRLVRGDMVYHYAKAYEALTSIEMAVHPQNLKYVRNAAIPTTAPIGSNQVTITVNTDDGLLWNGEIAAHEMEGGTIAFYKVGVAEWMVFSILDNSIAVAGGTTMVVTLDGELPVALTDTVDYCEEAIPSIYSNVTDTSAGGTRPFVGLPMRLATVAEPYFWVQTWGPARIAPEANVGAAADANQVVFGGDGACHLATNADAAFEYAQNAGFVLTRNEAGTQAAPLIFLQISP